LSRILDRYVVREILRTMSGVTPVLLVILVGTQFARVLARAASDRLPREAMFELMGLKTIEYLTVLLPLAMFFSIVLALGRLYRDSEMTVMAACGIGPSRLYRPVMLITGLVAAILAWLAFDARPLVAHRSHVVKVEAQRQLQSELIVPSRFRSTPDGRLVFYARSIDDDGTLNDIFIQRRRGDKIELAIAARAVQRSIAGGDGRELVLLDGRRFMGVPGTNDMSIVTFQEHGIPVILPPADTSPDDPEMLPTLDLLLVAGPEDWAEIHWRLASPVSLIILALLAVPLARSGARSSRYDRLGFAVLLYLIYSNLLGVAYSLVAKESVPAWLGYWWVLVPFDALAFLMMVWQSGWRPLRRRAEQA
jgi:lipopolysaccharide export system permease protein